jgi:hypothetical protein
MAVAVAIFISALVIIISLGLGWTAGRDYVIDEIKKEIDIRRKMQSPQDILTEVVKRLNEIKLKND